MQLLTLLRIRYKICYFYNNLWLKPNSESGDLLMDEIRYVKVMQITAKVTPPVAGDN
jgi:hypothetical protein